MEEENNQPDLNEKEDEEEEEEDEDSDDEFYEVDAILDHEEITDSQNSTVVLGYKYKILWKGYPIEQSSWEKESNLQCLKLLKDYKKSQGITCRRGRPKGSKNRKVTDKAQNNRTNGPRSKRTNSNYNFDEDFKPMIKYNLEPSDELTSELPSGAHVDLYTRVKQRRAGAGADPDINASSSGTGSRKPSTSSFGDVVTKDSKSKKKTNVSRVEESFKTPSNTGEEMEGDDNDDDMNESGKYLPPVCNGDLDESDEEPMAPYGRGIQLTAEEIEANFCDDDFKDAKMDTEDNQNDDDDNDGSDDEENVYQPDLYLAPPSTSDEESSDDDQTNKTTTIPTETTARNDDVTAPSSTLSFGIGVKEEPQCKYASVAQTSNCKFANATAEVKTEVVKNVNSGKSPDSFEMCDMDASDLPSPFFDPMFDDIHPEVDFSEELQPTPNLSEELQPTPDFSEELQPTPNLSEELQPTPDFSEELQPTPNLSEEPQSSPDISEEILPATVVFKKLKPPSPLLEALKAETEKEEKVKLTTPKEKRRISKSNTDEITSPTESRKSSNEERSAFDFLLTSIESPTKTDIEPVLKPSRLSSSSTSGGERSMFSMFANLTASTATGRGDENDGRIRLNDIRKRARQKRESEELQSKVEAKVNVAKSSGEKTAVKPASSGGDPRKKVENKSSPSAAADRKTTMMGSSVKDPRKRKLVQEDTKEASAIVRSSRARVADEDKKKMTATTPTNSKQKKQIEMKELDSELPTISKNKTTPVTTKRLSTPSACDPRLNRSFTTPRQRSDEKKTDGGSSSGKQKGEVHKSWKSRGRRVSDPKRVVETASPAVSSEDPHNTSMEVTEDAASMSDDFSPSRRRLDPFVESISILNKVTDPENPPLSASELFHLEHNKEFFEERVDLKLTRASATQIKGFFQQTAAKEGPCLSFHHPGSVQIQVGERKDSNENFRKYVKENNIEKVKETLSSLDMYNLEHEGENFLTPLQIASVNGFNEIVEILCYAGTNVNMKNRNTHQTPLIMAIDKGHEVIVRTLFKYGATLNDVSKNGETALYKAVKRGSYNIMKLLLTHGADVFSVAQDPVSRDPYIKPCIDAYLSYKQSAQEAIMKCIDHTVKKLRLRKVEIQQGQGASPILLMRGFSIRETFQLDFKFEFPRDRYQRSVPLMFAVHTYHDEESFQMRCRLQNECSVYGAFLNKVIMEPMYPETNTSNTHMVTYLDCRPGQNHLQLLIDQNSNSREVIYIVVCMVKYPKNF